ncbi:ABC transporter substrate-binding protein [Noviherbaspirillum galbum]|uniref:ABC transporter substrate-binding protein n=1 Tax=Noviherbaspirillum galbum TaxID=2709383 RepID=A0A6B3SLP6_9BURK|nr:ABC transporter substrate-binding protein [Noviherbaspirillum galbum]NEX61700.1 ABC transporter substrate-binding protein [Noviherbaspirillum galbum]
MPTLTRRLLNALAAVLLAHAGMAAPAFAKADMSKELRVAFDGADDGFDMVRTNNSLYSTWVGQAIYESLLTYDYLARPVKLVPSAAEAMPEVSDDGKTYLFHLRKGIYFSDDPAFKGKKRELTAADVVYSIKRIVDPVNRSPSSSSYEGKIAGLDDLMNAARKGGKFDYDKPIPGLEAVDSHTLRIRLVTPDPNMPFVLAHSSASIVAREVIEQYGQDSGRHPVGTGPYLLKEYVPRSKIVLEANPNYRGATWNFQPGDDKWDEQLVKDMKGKSLPLIGRVTVSIIEEEQSRWLAFSSGQLDFDKLADNVSSRVLDRDKLKPEFLEQKLSLYRFVVPDIVYTYFNFKDPVVGGYTNDKIALRRAIAMSYNVNDEIFRVRQGQAIKAQSQIVPGTVGYDPNYRSSIAYDPELANKLLDRFGYKKGDDGWRTAPDGKPLVIKMYSQPSAKDAAIMEVWKRGLDRIGLRSDFPVSNFADNLKAASRCELPIWMLGGTAGIPDAYDGLESFYGPNSGQGNMGCYQSEKFDAWYREGRTMGDKPERQALINNMNRQLEADTAVFPHVHRIRNWIFQPWIKGFKQHPIQHNNWMYLDIDKH